MNGDALLKRWLLDVRALSLVTEGSRNQCASENMLLFPTSELQALGVGVRQICEFLFEAHREYGRKAEPRGVTGWFYAWSDELSGTLRCSMVAVENVGDLPFRCQLQVVDTPEAIAQALVDSRYAHGIPAEELAPVQWDEDEETPPGGFCLTVFARRIGSASAAPLG